MNVADPPLPAEVLEQYLSHDEVERFGRLRNPRDLHRAVIARGALRAILGAARAVPPRDIVFRYGAKGKPALASDAGPMLDFSVSHSGGWVLIGLASGRRIGADVEEIRPIPEVHRIVERYFASRERSAFAAIPESGILEAFFTCWTRKEAYVKALGGGISHGFDTFAVAVGDADPPRILEVDGSETAGALWSVWSTELDPSHRASVAIEHPAARVIARRWLGSDGVIPWHSPASSLDGRPG